MIHFSIGCTWDRRLLGAVAELNETGRKKGRVVSEIYGSLPSQHTGLLSARPDFRLPNIDVDYFKSYAAEAHGLGLRVNYTVNAPFSMPIEEYANHAVSIRDMLRRLQDLGADVFTISNSLLIEMASKAVDVPLELSSVSHASSVAQIPVYHDMGIRHICMDVIRNRDISFLCAFQRRAAEFGIGVKLLANEMCCFGGAPCSGILQADCVMHSALGGNPQKLFEGWPFTRCAASRSNNPSAWLKSRFILPQWVDQYAKATNITHYKITGRTCRTDWLISVIRAYMEGRFAGDIRKLWVDPGDVNQSDVGLSGHSLNAEFLDSVGFLDKWMDKPSYRCDEHCGMDCTYCDVIAKKGGDINVCAPKK